jgi:polar amino acid transport system substrate-binding protein
MKKQSFTRKAPLVAVTALCLVAIAACGGGKSSSDPPASSPSTVTNSQNEVPAIAKLVPAAIRNKGTIVDGVNATYPPEGFTAADGHTLEGTDVDLVKALAGVLGLKVQIIGASFDTLIPGLQDGRFDIVASGMFETAQRESVIDMVSEYNAGEAFYVKTGSSLKIKDISSLCGHKVAVLTGSSELTNVQAQARKCQINVLPFANESDASLAVSTGRADVGFADAPLVGYVVQNSNGVFEKVGPQLFVVPVGIGLPKGNGMAKAVAAAMQHLITDGTYHAILAKWGMSSAALTSSPVVDGVKG